MKRMIVLLAALIALYACQPLPRTIKADDANPSPVPRQIVAQSDEFVILKAGSGDTPARLAHTYLRDADKGWLITEFNQIKTIRPGQEIIIPLRSFNTLNIDLEGYQTVPILCYHRFGGGPTPSAPLDNMERGVDRMSVSAESLEAQMRYLKEHDFHVLPIKDLVGFLSGTKQLPRKSVVITIDDGYRSVFDVAFPIFQKYRFPVTVFVYTDFIGAPAALSWEQINIMRATNLIDIQSHSKSHANLGLHAFQEDDVQYRKRIRNEIVEPHRKLRRNLGSAAQYFAYPYGDTSAFAIDQLRDMHYQLGLTVQSGGNAAFAYPYMLRRSMIYGDHDLTDFAARLQTYRRFP